jgi:4-hydroxybenzoyl-CoA thioesterase/acyl-CoA thioester hydrolase
MSVPFRTRRIVDFADTDMAGIVHFASYFRFLESAEHAYLRACGLSVMQDWEGERLTFPRVSASADFIKPARFEDELEISVRVDRIGRTSVTYAFEVFKGPEVIATGKITAVCCRVKEGHGLEPREVPEGIRARLLRGGGA